MQYNQIYLKNVTKRYRAGDVQTTALNDISLGIRDGEYVSIVGPSGSGKSTLIDVIGLLTGIDQGEMSFDNIKCVGLSEDKLNNLRRGKIGYIFQNYNLIEGLTVFGNVELPLLYLGLDAANRAKQVLATLARLGLEHRRNHFPSQLSGGQQQRVAIGRAFVFKPKVVLADEPTGNLDAAHGNEVMNLLEELNGSGTTLILVTHSQDQALRAPRQIVMADGKIASDTTNEAHTPQSSNRLSV